MRRWGTCNISEDAGQHVRSTRGGRSGGEPANSQNRRSQGPLETELFPALYTLESTRSAGKSGNRTNKKAGKKQKVPFTSFKMAGEKGAGLQGSRHSGCDLQILGLSRSTLPMGSAGRPALSRCPDEDTVQFSVIPETNPPKIQPGL